MFQKSSFPLIFSVYISFQTCSEHGLDSWQNQGFLHALNLWTPIVPSGLTISQLFTVSFKGIGISLCSVFCSLHLWHTCTLYASRSSVKGMHSSYQFCSGPICAYPSAYDVYNCLLPLKCGQSKGSWVRVEPSTMVWRKLMVSLSLSVSNKDAKVFPVRIQRIDRNLGREEW